MAKRTSKGFIFSRRQNESVLDRLSAWEQSVFQAVSESRTDISDHLKYRTTVPLDLLPVSQREAKMREFYEIIDSDRVIELASGGSVRGTAEAAAHRVVKSPLWRTGQTGKRAYGNFVVNPDDSSVLGYLYNQLNFQFRKPYEKNTVYDYFGVGSRSIPTTASIRSGMAPTAMKPGGKFTVFDLETGSLDFGQIRELSYASGDIAADGRLAITSNTSRYMKSAAFNRGMMAHDGKLMRLEDFMHAKFGIDVSGAAYGSGEDFINKTMPFLQRIMDSEYIVGHNISKFDIQQLFVGLSGTAAYKQGKTINGVNFRELVDNAHSHLEGRVVDTLTMAKNAKNLRNIRTAPELAAIGKSERYSISNLLLQTDLLRQAPELEELLNNGAGLHFGNVDAAITARLAELIPSLRTIDNTSMGTEALRRGIVRSAAITPITGIRDAAAISDPLLEHMIRTRDGLTTTSKSLQTLLGVAPTSRSLMNKAKAAIRSGEHDVRLDVNPIEQEVFHTRNLALESSLADQDTRMLAMGRFNRLTGQDTPFMGSVKRKFGMMSRTPSNMITQAQFEAFQASAQSSGLPYAGLSFEERRLGTAMSEITSTLAGSPNKVTMASLGMDSLISHFHSYNQIYLNLKNPNVRAGISPALLDYIDPDVQNRMVSFSPFRYAGADGGDVYGANVVYNFRSRDQVNNAMSKLNEILGKSDDEIVELFGVDPANVGEFRRGVEGLGKKMAKGDVLEQGISIARVDDSNVAKRLFGVITEFRGGIEADESALNISAQVLDSHGGVLRVGAPVVDRFLDEGAQEALAARGREALSYLDEFIPTMAENPKNVRTMRKILNAGSEERLSSMMRHADQYAALRPKMKKTLGIAALAGIGYYLNRKRKESNQLNEPMQWMPYEQGTSYSLYDQVELRKAAGENGARYMDPLATAPLVGSLYDNRTNHGNMAWDRNSALYGGVL